jgi:alpha-galactosidase
MRMDYGMLRLLSLQSTSDQTDYIYNSYIAANVASAVTPEQAGMWVYPYEDDEEHVIFNMINGILLRPYMSGMVWKLSDKSMNLLKEGVTLYKSIRNDIKISTPFWPIGFNNIHDEILAYGVKNESIAYLAVFAVKSDTAVVPLNFGDKVVGRIAVIYPAKKDCTYEYTHGILNVKMPQIKAARLFMIELQ